MTKITGYLCGPRLYEYDGWFFEVSASIGPWLLKKMGTRGKELVRIFFDE